MIFNQQSAAQTKVDELYGSLIRRRGASGYSGCPVDMTGAFLGLCLAQSCGKCVPCRVGLDRLKGLIEKILDGKGKKEDLAAVEQLARSIYDSADCAIGFEAAKLVLDGMAAFRDDYLSHIEKGVCTEHFRSVPCSAACPAHVDIPGYIALTGAGRYDDAVRLIRKDNPFPGACGLICEHPCELHCRRAMVDDAVNIRGLKRLAVEKAGEVPVPPCAPSNGKTVAVIGGGPAGLSAAYFLQLKGFAVTVFEKRPRLGGMLRYGIPAYRLPDEDLDRDINAILSTGVEVRCGVSVGIDITLDKLRTDYDSVYISIGAHGARTVGIPGEDAEGVVSAIGLFADIAEDRAPDYSGKHVAVIGGGNVAMDAARTAVRLGAASVSIVYRRRTDDMTALAEEIAGAQAEGVEILQLMSPKAVQVEAGKATGLVVKPQIPGAVKDGRPSPADSAEPEQVVPCDIIIAAVGQSIDSGYFAENGVKVNRGSIASDASGRVPGFDNVFTGGDCASGPATVIRAIDAGKVAADSIERYFGLHVPIACSVEIPEPAGVRLNWGRVNIRERYAYDRKDDFSIIDTGLTEEEGKQECSRCLRCDKYGYGAFREGRVSEW